MDKEIDHHAALAIITNEDRSRFYIQQKDEEYRIEEYRLGYAFFGGGVEDENARDAISRELYEELEERFASIIDQHIELFGVFNIISKYYYYKATMYESALPSSQLEELAECVVKEGRGVLVSREEIINLNFINNIDSILEEYLENK